MLKLEEIRHNYLVYGLTDDQLMRVASHAEERRLPAGTVLCHQGEQGGELFIVLEGKLSIQSGDGERLAEVGENSVVGEMGLVDSRPRSATVVSASDVRIAAIPSSALREEMVEDGHLGFLVLCNITRVLSDRLRQADSRLNALMESVNSPA